VIERGQQMWHDSVAMAQQAAVEDAASTGGRVFPCVVFYQGKRLMISTSVPYSFLQKHVQTESAKKGENPRGRTNRPLITEHVRIIQNYMRENADHYIMPPVTLNVRTQPRVHAHGSNASIRAGYLVVDDSTLFYVTDGQHRIAAISGHDESKRHVFGIIDEDEAFRNHGMAVQIVYEPEITLIHQDFADAAQTKPIPASLLAAYNMREPVNRVLAEIVDATFLRGRVDETSKSLPKLSQNLFLLNQVRGLVKELLIGDYAMADPQLDRHAKERIGSKDAQHRFVQSARRALDLLASEMTPWNDVASMPSGSDAPNRIPDYRAKYVNMTATGLVVIGRVVHEVNKQFDDPTKRDSYYRRLATEIDWRRGAEIWQNAIVQDNKVMTQRGPVRVAANRVMEQLNLEPGAIEQEAA
jgi:DNA sulfur modification protein DndB